MTTINKQVSLGTDDCLEYDKDEAWGGVNLTGATTKVGYAFEVDDSGFRWQSVNIPNAATIISAKLSLYLTNDTGTLSANIKGIDEDDTVTWASDDKPSDRAKTTATITANEANWNNWAVDSWIDIDITSIIQEIVDRVGWSANNALAVVALDTAGAGSNYMHIRSYEHAGNAHGAKLDIVYSDAIPMFKVDHGLVNHGLTRGGLIS